ncbi:hypothetical protein [Xanthomonas massiliensis]|uniref:hypothetical protein n=1 Tax=Xanthomonas massiliensis TaxID=1720302 RepID=UPI000825B1E7|nr:hypothetical protein [Xanthomonas massiliensis]
MTTEKDEVRAEEVRRENAAGGRQALAEVWGDTVDLRHLAGALLIGVGASLGAYAGALHALHALHALGGPGGGDQVAGTWAMLAGLVGCVLAGVVCAWLFPPKRIVSATGVDSEARAEAIAELCAEPRGLGTLDQLPAVVVQELEQLGLREAFERAQPGAEGGR